MLENVSSLLTLNPLIVYSTLALYALLFAAMFLYVHLRFRAAAKTLGFLKKDWASAQTDHMGLVEMARRRLSSLSAQQQGPKPTASTPAAPAPRQALNTDVRSQVAAMGKRGMAATEIARSTGLPEGDVDVLLGLARMQR